MSKRDFGTIKSLLHFDFPYFNEPGDGLGDEVGLETWTIVGNKSNIILSGKRPCTNNYYSPKFGYRYIQFIGEKGYIEGSNVTGIFNLSPSGNYEIECFISRYYGGGFNGNIFTFGDLVLGMEALKATITSTSWGINVTSLTQNITPQTSIWYHILLRIKNRIVSLYIDGVEALNASISGDNEIIPKKVILGSFSHLMGMDEFVFRHSAGEGVPTVPTQPYNGMLKLSKVGGFGTGTDGDVVIDKTTTINTEYTIDRIIDNHQIQFMEIPSNLNVGDELMILLHRGDISHIGEYVFRKVKNINVNIITLNKDVKVANDDDFNLEDIQEIWYDENDMLNYNLLYTIKIIKIPNYNSLTINADVTVQPVSDIVAFRCKGDCVVNGSIITHGKGSARSDLFQMTHQKLIDRFLYGSGGGIFITCGGTFTAPSTARIGATWSGNGDNNNGAAGYGGYGSVIHPQSINENMAKLSGIGSKGEIGGGGGGSAGSTVGCDAGCGSDHTYYNGTLYAGLSGTGGGGQGYDLAQGGSGGTAGRNINGGNSRSYVSSSKARYSGGGGGGAGGNGGSSYMRKANGSYLKLQGGYAGANLVLICKILNIEGGRVISTGGEGKYNIIVPTTNDMRDYSGGPGGGGTGFCYIACEEMI